MITLFWVERFLVASMERVFYEMKSFYQSLRHGGKYGEDFYEMRAFFQALDMLAKVGMDDKSLGVFCVSLIFLKVDQVLRNV